MARRQWIDDRGRSSARRAFTAEYNGRMFFLPCRVPVLFVLALAVVAGACQSRPSAPPSPPPVSPDVWAVVDGREIRREDVEKAYRRTVQPNPAMSNDEMLTAKLNLLDQMITEDIVLARARELKVELTEAEIDTAFNSGKKNIPDEAFNKELASRNLTAADMREGVRRDLTAQKLIEREVTSKIAVTDQDVNEAFEANKAQFNLTEDAYHIAQIVITAAKDPGLNNRTGDDATTAQAAAAKAQMLMERLKAGTPFDEVAMDYSEDPQSAPRGGDVGLVPVSALRQAPPQLREVVMKSQPGTVKVVGMEGGYTIVALVARQAAGQRDPSMPEVRDGITATLRGRREQLLRTAYIEAARNEARIVNHLARRLVESHGTLSATPEPAAAK
jgi:peptidyl-prolyl cis-trans isomerase SurA